jgi:hypothetical protein
MNRNLKDWISKNVPMQINDKIILPENVKQMISDCRYISETEGIEHGFNLYYKAGEIYPGNMIKGQKTLIAMDENTGRTKELRGAAWVGSCHAHPYLWKLSKRAAIGPSSGDVEDFSRNYSKLNLRRGVHFVIANWRLYMLVYKSNSGDASLPDYTPQYIYETTGHKLKEIRQRSREYNNQWPISWLFLSAPQQFEATDERIEDFAYDYYKSYSSGIAKYDQSSAPGAYQAERALNKRYKHGVGKDIGLPFNLPHNRALQWSEKSYEITLEYCRKANVGLAIEDIRPEDTSNGRAEGFEKPDVVRVTFDAGLAVKVASK